MFPDDVNGHVLRRMQESGADMSVEYDVDFEHVFADRSTAERFAKAVKSKTRNPKLSEYEGSTTYYWQVRVVVRMRPTHEGISRVERELGELANSFGGEPDGWGILFEPH